MNLRQRVLGEKGDTTRSYATRDGLEKALVKYGFGDDRYVAVRTAEGRWTAIFPLSNIQDGNLLRYSHRGFMTLG